MSQDGADLNVSAEQGMKAVIGGDEPKKLSDEEFEKMIRTAERVHSYDGCANRYARLVLEYLEANPEAGKLDAFDIYDAVKAVTSEEDRKEVLEEMTGFMVGWGVNAARHILKLKPVANPAIIEIG